MTTSKTLRMCLALTALASLVLATAADADGRKKNPTSKIYVADVEGDAQIDTGETIDPLTKRSVYTAQGTVIETKHNATNSMVFSNGTGVYFDPDTGLEVRKFVQEPFTPNRRDMEVEPSISNTQSHLPRGAVGLCTSKLVAGSVMQYSTPHANVRIKGSKSVINSTDERTFVSVLDGEVTVQAGSFARHGRKTLLIDCDLRRPMLHRHFKQENTAGLITWFEAGANVDSNLETDPSLGIIKLDDNLSLLCSGGRSKSPTELLESPLFGHLLERLKKQYDLVVVDSPPLGAVTDSLLIAERTDEVIYVCRFNRAYRKHIRLHIKALRNAKNEILGVVLNGLTPRRIEYYSNYRYYRSYKKYYGAQS